MKRPVVRTTDFRPKGQGAASPLERTTIPRPGAAACLHYRVASTYSDHVLASIIESYGSRNLSDYRDHETRWLAERVSACRKVRRERKTTKP